MYKIIALMGEAGAGKDTLMQEVLKMRPDFHEIISCTTRPIREGEAHGVNYYYYTVEQFGNKVLDGEMLECTVFNDWFYGTSFDSVRSGDIINIGVFNPTGVESLLERPDCDVCVFWVKTNDKTRLLRQLNREENPNVQEIIRRFSADYNDFSDIDFNYSDIYNNVGEDLSVGAEQIVGQSESWFARGQK